MFDENIIAKKKILRQEINLRLKNLTPEDRVKFSRAVVEKFLASTLYKNAAVIMVYLSTAEEIQLNEFIATALEQKKILAVPLIEGREILSVRLTNLEALEVGVYKILTVKRDVRKFIDAEKIDCVITPGLAFDADCNRLGKGGGYYDKFLDRAVKAKRIALAYDCQLVEKVPVEPHDLKVDAVITPTKIWEGEVKVGIGN